MDNVLLMKISQGTHGLRDQQTGLVGIQSPLAVDVLVQVDAVDVIQRQKVDAIDFSKLVQADDVLMPKFGVSSRFAAKSLQGRRILGQAWQENLERHRLPGLFI